MSEAAEESPGGKTGGLVPQKHGGAIWQGPPKNPMPGPGRPKGEVRQTLLQIVDECGLAFVQAVLSGEVEGATLDQQIRVAGLAFQYALGTQKEVTVEAVREKLGETVRVMRDELPDELAARVLSRMREIWK